MTNENNNSSDTFVDVLGNRISKEEYEKKSKEYFKKLKHEEDLLRRKIRSYIMAYRDDFKKKKFQDYLKILSFSYLKDSKALQTIRQTDYKICTRKHDEYYYNNFVRAFLCIVEGYEVLTENELLFINDDFEQLFLYDQSITEEQKLENFIKLWKYLMTLAPNDGFYINKVKNNKYSLDERRKTQIEHGEIDDSVNDLVNRLLRIEQKLDSILSIINRKL